MLAFDESKNSETGEQGRPSECPTGESRFLLRGAAPRTGHGMERLIGSLAEDVIDKEQFTSRANRAKTRMVDIDTEIGAQAADKGLCAHLRSVMSPPADSRVTCNQNCTMQTGLPSVKLSAPY